MKKGKETMMTDEDWNIAIERAAKLLDQMSKDCLGCLEANLTKEAETYQLAADTIRKELKRPVSRTNSIDINGKTHVVFKTSLTYDELIELAGERGQPTVVFSIGGVGGSVCPGKSVNLSPKMRFTIIHTNNA